MPRVESGLIQNRLNKDCDILEAEFRKALGLCVGSINQPDSGLN